MNFLQIKVGVKCLFPEMRILGNQLFLDVGESQEIDKVKRELSQGKLNLKCSRGSDAIMKKRQSQVDRTGIIFPIGQIEMMGVRWFL